MLCTVERVELLAEVERREIYQRLSVGDDRL